MTEPLIPPNGWGEDSLTNFWAHAERQRWATFSNIPGMFERLVKIDSLFLKMFQDWRDPPQRIPPLLAFRSHSAFRVAAGHASAGQLGDEFPAIRSALEQAAYALFMSRRPETIEPWLRRHDDDESLRSVREIFSARKIEAATKAADRWAGQLYADLYQLSIDYGAHPNELGISINTSIVRVNDTTNINQMHLHDDPDHIRFGLAQVIECGVCVLCLLKAAFPDRLSKIQNQDLETLRLLVDKVRSERAKAKSP